MEIWEAKLRGTLWATPGLLRDCFTFTSQLDGLASTQIISNSMLQSFFEVGQSALLGSIDG